MIPEIGQISLIVALAVAFIIGILPLYGSFRGNANFIAIVKPAAIVQWLLVAISFGCLVYAFVTDDFSVRYAASTSNSALPVIYKVAGVWGGHEGSLLLLAFILTCWTVAVALLSKSIPPVMLGRVISILGFISVGFLLFILLTSNPFDRIPMQPEGRDLNPLLQDFGLAVHPPMLYIGYIGFAVAYAFAVAALIGGKLDAAWARWARPWTNIAWAFLTIGIALGSWWAYYELGWGGWWFWDAVENASLMPWILGTALMHSLIVTEKRGMFKAWTILLAVGTFSLSLLGMFLVRSGIITSVHSFASDPTRGVFILFFLAVVIGVALVLFSFRAPKLASTAKFELLSKETGLLTNNVILVVMTLAVLLGTLFPLITDALSTNGKISVGPPYFNMVMVPLAVVLAIVMGMGLLLRWKSDNEARLKSLLIKPLIIALVFAILVTLLSPMFYDASFSGYTFMGILISGWIIGTAVLWIVKQKRSLTSISGSSWGALFGHVGLAVSFIGITMVSIYNHEKDVSLAPGASYDLEEFTFKFMGVTDVEGPNYVAHQGLIEISRNGKKITELKAEKRTYRVQTMPMTEAGIDAGFFRDLFVALGEPLDKKGTWSLRLQYKPYIRWLWLGAILMAMGAIFATLDKRYRRLNKMGKSS